MRFRLTSWPQLATITLFALSLIYLAWLGWGMLPGHQVEDRDFDGHRAMTWARAQCDLGPRPAGSPASEQVRRLILNQLRSTGWQVRAQNFQHGDTQLQNLVAIAGEGEPVLVLATHYDTRLTSDLDPNPNRRDQPTMGANDGASGVSVLLELARSLDKGRLKHTVWLVFLDGEANRGLPQWQDELGAEKLTEAMHPTGAIYLNLVGGKDARFPKVPDATRLFQDQVWALARRLGEDEVFISSQGPKPDDAHTILLNAGIPTITIQQPDYAYLHTTQDTCNKLDARSLEAVGRVVEIYLEEQRFMTIAPALK